MRQCEVYVHGSKAGILMEDNNREYVFVYDKSYLSEEKNPPVSLTLPLREEPYHSSYLFRSSLICCRKERIDRYNRNYCTLMQKMILASCSQLHNMIQ